MQYSSASAELSLSLFISSHTQGNQPHRESMIVKDYQHLVFALNHDLTEPCEFNETGLVGFPINAILNWPLATEAGFAASMH